MRRRVTVAIYYLAVFAAGLAVASACRRAAESVREYPVKGQLLSIGSPRSDGRREVSLKQEDIPGFMPAMTMAYFVKRPQLLEGMAPGDLVQATLVLTDSEMYLDPIEKTGHTALPPDAKPVRVMDVMQPGDEVPDDELTDQDGATRRLSDWHGQAVAVTFVYTRCPLPDFCPLMDRRFADLQRAIAADPALAGRVHLVSISFDPSYDTPAVIAAHARARGADPHTWTYLTGTREAIDRLTSKFGVSVISEADAAQPITHNLRTAIVDPHGRLVKIYSGNDWTADALLRDLREANAT